MVGEIALVRLSLYNGNELVGSCRIFPYLTHDGIGLVDFGYREELVR